MWRQGQMISLEGSTAAVRQVAGVRVVAPAASRASRPLLLAAGKPLHNIILQASVSRFHQITINYFSNMIENICITVKKKKPHCLLFMEFACVYFL